MKIKVEIVVDVDVDDMDEVDYEVENVSRTLANDGIHGLRDGRNPMLKSLVATYARRHVFEGK